MKQPDRQGQLDPTSAAIGARIHAARHEAGLTLAQLGGDELSRSFLSAVEHGRSRISLRALSIVAARLNRPISAFLDEEQSPDPSTDEPSDVEPHRLHIHGPNGVTIDVDLFIRFSGDNAAAMSGSLGSRGADGMG